QGLLRQSDPDMDIDEALTRRDFTMNAMAWDPDILELRDPFNGRADVDAHVLRHMSERFSEDPLRVLRGMQLTARFGLTAAPETVALCKTLTQDGQPSGRL
ncbi:MAG: CCA tRNA nucleotidyltransferase, partial [Nitrospiraceae bacterium]